MISERVTDNRRKNSNKRARGKQSTVGTGESPDNNTHHIHTRGRDSETARHGRQQSDTGNGLLTTPSRCLPQSAGSPAALFPPPLSALFHAIYGTDHSLLPQISSIGTEGHVTVVLPIGHFFFVAIRPLEGSVSSNDS